MSVATNYAWEDPRKRYDLGLLGGGALGAAHAEGGEWFLAAFDVSNAFTSVELPEWMWVWFATPAILA